MKELGFSKIIGTPHTYHGLYNNTNQTINNAFKKLKGKFPMELRYLMLQNI